VIPARVTLCLSLALCLACATAPPKLERATLPPPTDATAYDLDKWSGDLPTPDELARVRSARVDPQKFYELITQARPRSGKLLWLGGFLIVTQDESHTPQFYLISYYGSCFRKVGESGWYDMPIVLQGRWEDVIRPALTDLISQRRSEPADSH